MLVDSQCFIQKLLFLLELLLQALYFHLQLDVLQRMKTARSIIITTHQQIMTPYMNIY